MAKINGDGDNGLKKVTGREEDDLDRAFICFFLLWGVAAPRGWDKEEMRKIWKGGRRSPG